MEDEICAACTERISTLWDEISILREKSQILKIENPRISEKIIRRESEITELEEIMEKISLQQKQKKRVIAFVDTVDNAHEYFDLKDYLRAECGRDKYNFWQDDIEDILVKLSKDTNMFNRVSEEDIAYAVDDHVVNVRTIHKFEHVHGLCETEYRKVKGITSELTIEDYKEMARMFPHLCLQKRYENEEPDPDTNPVYRVVCRSRDKNYIMDENPEVELQKIEESTEGFNDICIYSDEEVEEDNTFNDEEEEEENTENTDSCISSDEEEEEKNTDSCISSDEEEEENTDSYISSNEEEEENIDSYISSDEEEENTENDAPDKFEDIANRFTEENDAPDKFEDIANRFTEVLDKYSKLRNRGKKTKKVEDIANRFTEALDKYSKLRSRGKKTENTVKDDSSADRLDNYNKLKNFSEDILDKNMRNRSKDSDRYDCGADWVTVSVP